MDGQTSVARPSFHMSIRTFGQGGTLRWYSELTLRVSIPSMVYAPTCYVRLILWARESFDSPFTRFRNREMEGACSIWEEVGESNSRDVVANVVAVGEKEKEYASPQKSLIAQNISPHLMAIFVGVFAPAPPLPPRPPRTPSVLPEPPFPPDPPGPKSPPKPPAPPWPPRSPHPELPARPKGHRI